MSKKSLLALTELGVALLFAAACAGCSSETNPEAKDLANGGAAQNPGAGGTGGTNSAGASASGGAAAGNSNTGGAGNGGSAGTASQGGGAGSGNPEPQASTPSPMPLISRGVPAFASTSEYYQVTPDKANDDSPTTAWVPTALPGWIAYDLSGAPEAERQGVLVAWYVASTQDYLNPVPGESQELPVDYTLEINSAAGGGDPPATGWVGVATVTDNHRNAREHLVDLGGANWVRMSISKSTAPVRVALNLDVHSAPDGASDVWLFMGDSITAMTMRYPVSDLPSRVHDLDGARWPVVVPAGIGGTNTTSALQVIDETLADYPGRFVVLGYGTNDHAAEFVMEDVVERVLAAGKIPAIPHQPWTDVVSVQNDGIANNQTIDALYEKYPEIFRGPDLWGRLENRLDLMPSGDIHPSDAGTAEIRAAWAEAMTAQ